MRIVVCVKPSVNGELGPFDAAAYEAALRIDGAEVILLSMAPSGARELLLRLTRLGAKEAYLLSDSAFAGADTLATGYTLSLALQRLQPQLVLCGRQTLEGDTGQVGIGIAARMGYALATRVMHLDAPSEYEISCTTRSGERKVLSFPALLTVERIHDLRLPGLFSQCGSVTLWNAADLGADRSRCGLSGSPTRVVKTFENELGKRHCLRIAPSEFQTVLNTCLSAPPVGMAEMEPVVSGKKLPRVFVYGARAMEMAKTVGETVTLCETNAPAQVAAYLQAERPDAVIFEDSDATKGLSGAVAVLLGTGLCADCTHLETDGETLYMVRPAFSGNLIAKIVCSTMPPMATVRTRSECADLIFSVGRGAVAQLPQIADAANRLGAQLCATRAVVDMGKLPYETQVGLTGKRVAPRVYVALGISGAVHHLAGISGAQTILAVNSDANAPIFEYADYGMVADVAELFSEGRK